MSRHIGQAIINVVKKKVLLRVFPFLLSIFALILRQQHLAHCGWTHIMPACIIFAEVFNPTNKTILWNTKKQR